MGRFFAAFKAFRQVLAGADLVPRSELDKLMKQLQQAKSAPAPKPAPPPPKVDDRFNEGAVYTLLLLQREGRLIDFLQENLDAYADDQIGAAVRQIHKDSAKVLRESFGLAPVMTQGEGEAVSVGEGFDATTVTLTGNVPEKPPYNGTLRHKGWKAAQVRLPERTGKVNTTLVQPAEIEI